MKRLAILLGVLAIAAGSYTALRAAGAFRPAPLGFEWTLESPGSREPAVTYTGPADTPDLTALDVQVSIDGAPPVELPMTLSHTAAEAQGKKLPWRAELATNPLELYAAAMDAFGLEHGTPRVSPNPRYGPETLDAHLHRDLYRGAGEHDSDPDVALAVRFDRMLDDHVFDPLVVLLIRRSGAEDATVNLIRFRSGDQGVWLNGIGGQVEEVDTGGIHLVRWWMSVRGKTWALPADPASFTQTRVLTPEGAVEVPWNPAPMSDATAWWALDS